MDEQMFADFEARLSKLETEIERKNAVSAKISAAHISEIRKSKMETAWDTLIKMSHILSAYEKAEKSISRLCAEERLTIGRFYYVLDVLSGEHDTKFVKSPDIYSCLTGIERLYQAVFSVYDGDAITMIPDDGEEAVKSAASFLPEREQTVIIGRFLEDKTLDTIAQSFGGPRERVRQIEVRAIRRMRNSNEIKSVMTLGKSAYETAVEQYTKEKEKKILEYKEVLIEKDADLNKMNGFADFNGTIDDLGLSIRAYNCLARAGVVSLKDLCQFSVQDLLKIRNLGRHSAEEIVKKAREFGVLIS